MSSVKYSDMCFLNFKNHFLDFIKKNFHMSADIAIRLRMTQWRSSVTAWVLIKRSLVRIPL